MTHSQPPIAQISVTDLATQLASAATPLQLIDVREPEELAIAQIDGFVNLPLSQFSEWSEQIHQQFDPNAETFVLCHHGMRSAQMCHWLANQGFSHVWNIAGGIDAYATAVDPAIPRY